VLPLNVAMRVALMGKHERLSAQRAYDLGLVTEVVAPDALGARLREIADAIATITLDRPDALNAFNRTMCEEMRTAWSDCRWTVMGKPDARADSRE
jgi:enoyl-CoA hydratase/carnithine racemase